MTSSLLRPRARLTATAYHVRTLSRIQRRVLACVAAAPTGCPWASLTATERLSVRSLVKRRLVEWETATRTAGVVDPARRVRLTEAGRRVRAAMGGT